MIVAPPNDDDENEVPTSSRRHRRQHSSWQVLADIMLLMFQTMVFVIAALLVATVVATKTNTGDTHPQAEYLLTLTWENTRNVDLDLWLRDPQGKVIYYGAREAPNESLDRDSQGYVTNRTVLPDGTVKFSANREIISLRVIEPGDYLLAVSYYAGQSETTGLAYTNTDTEAPIDATVKVEKVNPKLTQVATTDVHFDHVHEAVNALAFHIGPDGTVTTLSLPADNLVYVHGGAHP
jgi:hypothetical protein